ncbi:perosamine synthetase [Gammaproteobacteria bacterium]
MGGLVSDQLALEGGTPVRSIPLPYGRHWISEQDITAVVETLRSDWLTTGPRVSELEEEFASVVGVSHAVAVSSGTAGLHVAVSAIGIQPGDEVIVPTMTFAASANCIAYRGGIPVFADVDPNTLLLTPEEVEKHITPRTRAILAVDYTGAPCDYVGLRALAQKYDLALLADGCHSLGAATRAGSVGSLADLTVFSLHPVKSITAGEGGVITTEDPDLARKMRIFRNHGMTNDFREREQTGQWQSQMVELGFNYRITDLQCALALSQLRRLPEFITRRQAIAQRYDAAFANVSWLSPLSVPENVEHAYHLYVVRLHLDQWTVNRDQVLRALRAEGISTNVHYWPVHLHPYYQRTHSVTKCPVATSAANAILSLPIFPKMLDTDIKDVLLALEKVFRHLGQPN